MANMNIRTPVFYPDRIRYQKARGSTAFSIVSGSGLLGFQSGTIGSLHNGKPLDLCSFDTSANVSDHILFNYDMGTSQWKTTFITILNHNLATAVGKIRIFFGSTSDAVDDVNGGSSATSLSSTTPTTVLNCSTPTKSSSNKSIHVAPSVDGTTIIKIENNDGTDFTGYRYVGIQFEGNTNPTSDTGGGFNFNSSTDLTIGGIEIGEIYTMPVAPDLNVKRSIIYDKTTIQESLGGQKYATTSSTGRTASSTSKSPFITTNYQHYVLGGRLAYEMSFSYLQSTDVMPNEYVSTQFADDSFVGDVWSITDGNFHPFVFSIDSTSTGSSAESEFIYARFAQNSLVMDQVAPDVFNIKLKIEEEF
tara:strand:- start:5503 stop:6588 length:1086 start_codon:yes stop_codon:yes gene_type:complete